MIGQMPAPQTDFVGFLPRIRSLSPLAFAVIFLIQTRTVNAAIPGAAGNGITDDTLAIQNAINALPALVYWTAIMQHIWLELSI